MSIICGWHRDAGSREIRIPPFGEPLETFDMVKRAALKQGGADIGLEEDDETQVRACASLYHVEQLTYQRRDRMWLHSTLILKK